MKIAVVLNESAGTLLDEPITQAISDVERLFEQTGHSAQVTAAKGPAIVKAIEAALTSDADAIVVGGGDGTVASAAERVIGTEKALGILPLGTLNLYAKDLKVPLDLAAAVVALGQGHIRHLDVGEVNGRLFLSHSVMGLYPLMVEDRERQRALHGRRKWPAMAMAGLKALRTYPLLDVALDLPHGRKRILTPALAVSNNRYDDGFGTFLRRSVLDGGELALYVAKHRNPYRMIRLMVGLVLGDWQRDTELEVMTLQQFTVRSRRRRLKIANDGEVIQLEGPLHYRIRPRALRVLVPGSEHVEQPETERITA